MKKQLKIGNEDKRLIAINTYLNLFFGELKEVVDKDTENIYLYEYGDIYAKILIQKKSLECWVEYYFWEEFSELFSLDYDDTKLFITIWVEDVYQLKGIDTDMVHDERYDDFIIPTN